MIRKNNQASSGTFRNFFPNANRHGKNQPSRGSQHFKQDDVDRFDHAINQATAMTVPRPAAATINTSHYTASRQNLRIIPMGGIEEVGENMTVLEYGDDLIVIDMGLAFPGRHYAGHRLYYPRHQMAGKNKKRIRGVIITHGHLDHIGAIPYILPKIGDPPIYTMALTAGFIKKAPGRIRLLGRSKVNVMTKDDVLALGNFKIRFFRLNHSIPDSVGLSITTPVGQIVYATDWKFDHTPADGKPTEFDKIAKFGAEGVLLVNVRLHQCR